MVQRKKKTSRRKKNDAAPSAGGSGGEGGGSIREQSSLWASKARDAHDNCERGKNAQKKLKQRRNRSGQ